MIGEPKPEAFWQNVRSTLKAFLEAAGKSSNAPGKWTQAKLASKLGVHPTTLANFLSGTNHQISGFAIANACTLGIEFTCSNHRIGRLEDQTTPMPLSEQLVLEFSEDFSIAQESGPLTVELKRKPTKSDTRTGIRLKIVS
jgi:transcriptional regulator with XRE-family HTH domain